MTKSAVSLSLIVLLACGDDAPASEPDAEVPDAEVPDAEIPDADVPDVLPPGCREDPTDPAPPIPDPGEPASPPELDCGVPEIAEGTGLWRWPYLESATQTSVRIAWTSRTGAPAVVRYAADPTGEWTEVAAARELFDRARTAQEADYSAYDATLEGLQPGSAYCYEIVEDGTVLARNLRFDTAWEGTDRPVNILVLGDSGNGSEEQLAIRDAFMGESYDVFLHVGDMAYGDGEFFEFEARFFDVYQTLMHRTPVFPAIGNHEYKTELGRPYRDVYHNLENAWRERDKELYYSFDYGNIHFTALDSNDAMLIPIYLDFDGLETQDMFDWMIDDISSSDADWKIVYMHHPFYSSSERGIREGSIEVFRTLLEELGVDLILAGHDHHYERSFPIVEGCNNVNPTGVTEIIAGGAGAGIRDIEFPNSWHSARIYNGDNSYLRVEIHGCRLRGEALNTANEVVDEFELNGCD
ncbi:MAG: metallophosphoesterase [Myxococcota bacterium]